MVRQFNTIASLRHSIIEAFLSRRFYFHVFDHLIDQPIFHGFLGRHEAVAVGVLLDLFQRMAGVLEQDARSAAA